MKKALLGLLGLLVLLAAIAVMLWPGWSEPTLPEHQIFYNGTVITVDDNNTLATAVVLERDRIAAVGSDEDMLALRRTVSVVHDLKGAVLIPGFIDAHGHFPGTGITALSADLNSPPIGGITDIAELQQALRQFMETSSKHWVLGIGYDDTLLAEKRHPTRAELDAVSTERPIFIMHVSGHMGVANSLALREAGIDRSTADPAGGAIEHDADGELTGLLLETSAAPVQALAFDFSVLDFMTMVKVAAQQYTRAGVTLAQSGGVDGSMATGLSLMSKLKLIPQRLELWPMQDSLGEQLLSGDVTRGDLETDKVRLGAIKFITDGSIQGYTGYLAHPYHVPYHGDADYRGFPVLDEATLPQRMKPYHEAGYQLALHGNGDAAIDNILSAWQAVQDGSPAEDRRPIIIHAQMARKDQLLAMKQTGMTPSFFSAHTYYWGDRHRDIFMGPTRASNMSPTAWASDIGLKFSVHLDAPVVPMQPRLLWWSTVNRVTSSGKVIGEHQRVSPLQALKAMTIDAAWQIHREDELGSIEPGKFADLVILDRNPLQSGVDPRDAVIQATIIGGRQYYRADE